MACYENSMQWSLCIYFNKFWRRPTIKKRALIFWHIFLKFLYHLNNFLKSTKELNQKKSRKNCLNQNCLCRLTTFAALCICVWFCVVYRTRLLRSNFPRSVTMSTRPCALMYLLLGLLLDACDQMQHFISSLTDDRIKPRMHLYRYQIGQGKKA